LPDLTMTTITQHGQFITLEGIEGVGKSTHAKFIKKFLEDKNINILATHEPGGTPLANAIRGLLLTPATESAEPITPITELLLLFAARAQHIINIIEPNLAKGNWVICDRFTDASYAYQGYGRGQPLEYIETLEQWVQRDLQPNCTFLFDAPVEVALQRIKHRNLDRIECEAADFFQRVRAGYLARAKQFPQRYKIIDASVPLNDVQQQIKVALKELVDR